MVFRRDELVNKCPPLPACGRQGGGGTKCRRWIIYNSQPQPYPQSQSLPKPKQSYIIKVYIKTLQKNLTKAPRGGENNIN